MTIPSFRRTNIPVHPVGRPREVKLRFRGSARERGYDRDWERLRDERKKHFKGLCQECLRRGYAAPLDVIDHIIPIRERPDLRLDPDNTDGLCHVHHNGWKAKLEKYAEKSGQVNMLPVWVRQPDMRPPRFTILRYGPLGPLETDDEGAA